MPLTPANEINRRHGGADRFIDPDGLTVVC